MKYLKNFRVAFTIVELLVVISVLTILISIGMPKIKGFMDNARNAQAQKELQTIQAALQSYYTFSSPNAYPPSSTAVTNNYLKTAIPQIVSGVLYDPFAGTGSNTEYNYLRSSNGKYFLAYSVGYNGTSTSTPSVNTSGVVNGLDSDDLCVSNGTGCETGAMRCGTGLYNCSGTCSDLQTSPNCGACGVTCTGGKGCACGGCYLPGLEPC